MRPCIFTKQLLKDEKATVRNQSVSWNENKELHKAGNTPSGNIAFSPNIDIDYCQVKQFPKHRHDFTHLFEFAIHLSRRKL